MQRHIVTTVSDMEAMLKELKHQGEFAFDTEARSKDFGKYPDGALRKLEAEIDIASFSTAQNAFAIPLGMVTVPCLDLDVFVKMVKPIMEDPEFTKLAWNFCYDAHIYANLGIWVANYQDIMVAAHLLDENRSVGLKERCKDVQRELHKFDFKTYWKTRLAYLTKAVDKKGVIKATEAEVHAIEADYLQYATEDAEATFELKELYLPELQKDPKMWYAYENLFNPGVRTVFNMERRGSPIDVPYMQKIAEECKKDKDEAESNVYKIAGKHLNLASTKALGELLYNDLGLPVFNYTYKGAPSTDKETLEKLAQKGHKIAEYILRYRRLEKLYGTYLDPEGGLSEKLYPWNALHSNYNITGTGTGRLSSSGPNLQQIPRDSEKTYHIRRSFVPHKGYRLVGGDWSQIELRIMAHLSGDDRMVKVYRDDYLMWKALNEGRSIEGLPKSDIHTETANACNSTRNSAKAINFGIIYGMFANLLGETLTSVNFNDALEKGRDFDPISDIVPPALAQEFIDGYFAKYPGVKAYQEYISDYVRKNGFVKTRFGRMRRLPDAFSGDRNLINRACRQGINMTVQGHVGELMLLLMNKTDQVIDNEHGRALKKIGFRLFKQVHDEILGECPDNDQAAQDSMHHLIQIFQNPLPPSDAYPFAGYRVPIVFEPHQGYSWADVH